MVTRRGNWTGVSTHLMDALDLRRKANAGAVPTEDAVEAMAVALKADPQNFSSGPAREVLRTLLEHAEGLLNDEHWHTRDASWFHSVTKDAVGSQPGIVGVIRAFGLSVAKPHIVVKNTDHVPDLLHDYLVDRLSQRFHDAAKVWKVRDASRPARRTRAGTRT